MSRYNSEKRAKMMKSDAKRIDLGEIDRKWIDGEKARRVVEKVLAVNDSRGHGLPKTALTRFVRGFLKRDPDWFDRHHLVMLTYDDNGFSIVNRAIISLVERYADEGDYIVRPKSPNGRSIAFTGEAADELFAKSDIAVGGGLALKRCGTGARHCEVAYPLRRKLKSLGGERLKDVIVRVAGEMAVAKCGGKVAKKTAKAKGNRSKPT